MIEQLAQLSAPALCLVALVAAVIIVTPLWILSGRHNDSW